MVRKGKRGKLARIDDELFKEIEKINQDMDIGNFRISSKIFLEKAKEKSNKRGTIIY